MTNALIEAFAQHIDGEVDAEALRPADLLTMTQEQFENRARARFEFFIVMTASIDEYPAGSKQAAAVREMAEDVRLETLAEGKAYKMLHPVAA